MIDLGRSEFLANDMALKMLLETFVDLLTAIEASKAPKFFALFALLADAEGPSRSLQYNRYIYNNICGVCRVFEQVRVRGSDRGAIGQVPPLRLRGRHDRLARPPFSRQTFH